MQGYNVATMTSLSAAPSTTLTPSLQYMLQYINCTVDLTKKSVTVVVGLFKPCPLKKNLYFLSDYAVFADISNYFTAYVKYVLHIK